VLAAKKRHMPQRFISVFLTAISVFILGFSVVGEAATPKVTFEWLIEPQFHAANPFSAGVAWVQKEKDGPWTMIDENGRIVIEEFRAKSISRYDESTGLAAFCNYRNLEGYINLSGDIAIPPRYTIAYTFRDSVAVVVMGPYVGIIDQNGETILPLRYDFIMAVHNDLFAVKKDKDGGWGYMNDEGEIIVDFIFQGVQRSTFPENVCTATLDGKMGLLDAEGQWIVPASYDNVFAGREGLIGLEKDGRVGFVDAKGDRVIDYKFIGSSGWDLGYFYTFSEGLAVVLLSELPPYPLPGDEFPLIPPKTVSCGVIDKKGSLLFQFRGFPVSIFHEGFLLVQSDDDTFNLIDRSGKLHTLPKNVEPNRGGISKGVLCVKKKDKYGYLKINLGKD